MDNCDPDYVAIYDVEIDRDEPKIKLCGRQATMVRTIGNHMNLKLVASSPAAGFNAHYQLPALVVFSRAIRAISQMLYLINDTIVSVSIWLKLHLTIVSSSILLMTSMSHLIMEMVIL